MNLSLIHIYENLMAIFNAEEQDVYIMDYNHLDVYACRIIVPGMSDIYPADEDVYKRQR